MLCCVCMSHFMWKVANWRKSNSLEFVMKQRMHCECSCFWRYQHAKNEFKTTSRWWCAASLARVASTDSVVQNQFRIFRSPPVELRLRTRAFNANPGRIVDPRFAVNHTLRGVKCCQLRMEFPLIWRSFSFVWELSRITQDLNKYFN